MSHRDVYVFDLDGTLVDMHAVDARCLVEAARNVHGIVLDDDSSRYTQPIDSDRQRGVRC